MKLPKLDLPRFLNVRTDRRVKNPSATVVMIHGIGNTADAWNDVIHELPPDVRIITVDLLGFGDSPKPTASYNVRVQARSIASTLVKQRLFQRVILVGHSLGALISIEIAKRYPYMVRGLILCSPPIYKNDSESSLILSSDKILTKIYKVAAKDAKKKPEFYKKAAKIAKVAKITSPSFTVNDDTLPSYIKSLKSSIIHQNSFDDISKLKMPIHIIYGRFDPLVVSGNLKDIAKNNANITAQSINAMHEVTNTYTPKIIKNLEKMLKTRG